MLAAAARTDQPEPAPARSPLEDLRKIALAQLDLTIELLASRPGAPTAHTVHETRKALKRLRALMRLLRLELGPRRFGRENAVLRDAGRALAGARDTEVMVSTLEELVKRHPKRLARSAAVARLRAELLDQRERATVQAFGEADARELALETLAQLRARVAAWSFEARNQEAVRLGLARLYREGRKRRRRAQRRGTIQSRHDWRKRVKDLRYASEMLARPGRPGRGLRAVAAHADRLGELLGAEHDLALLAGRVREEKACFDGERATRKDLLRLIARRRTRLRRRALRLGKRLYRPSPRKFAATLE